MLFSSQSSSVKKIHVPASYRQNNILLPKSRFFSAQLPCIFVDYGALILMAIVVLLNYR